MIARREKQNTHRQTGRAEKWRSYNYISAGLLGVLGIEKIPRCPAIIPGGTIAADSRRLAGNLNLISGDLVM
jgi:hypothetical protein